MAQLRGPTAFYQLSEILIDGISTVLTDSLGGAVARACVVPGEIAWDQCDCGLLAVSVRRWFISDEFPEGAVGRGALRDSPCDQPWLVAELTIQVVRCAPSPQGNGMISVPCVDLDQSAQVVISDAYVTITEVISILCEMKDTDQIIDYVVGDQVAVGPDGGCVGSELSLFISLYR